MHFKRQKTNQNKRYLPNERYEKYVYRMHASNNRGYYLFFPLFRVKLWLKKALKKKI